MDNSTLNETPMRFDILYVQLVARPNSIVRLFVKQWKNFDNSASQFGPLNDRATSAASLLSRLTIWNFTLSANYHWSRRFSERIDLFLYLFPQPITLPTDCKYTKLHLRVIFSGRIRSMKRWMVPMNIVFFSLSTFLDSDIRDTKPIWQCKMTTQ